MSAYRALPFLALAVAAVGCPPPMPVAFDLSRPRHLEAPARVGRGWSGIGNLPPSTLNEMASKQRRARQTKRGKRGRR